jgi:hypothetical protein
VLAEIRRELPAEHLSYVADSAHAPYGEQPERLGCASAPRRITDFLIDQRAKAIVIHPPGEQRYGRQGTPRAALSFVTTRWNRMTIPPRRALLSTPRDAP